MTDFVEIKHTLEGKTKRYDVQLVKRAPGMVVVRFESDRTIKHDGVEIESGSVTLGYFWEGRAYNVYRLAAPGGMLIAHRLDILRDVRIGADRVEWTDLLVDAWVWPDGRVVWKDEEELERFARAGKISQDDVAHVARTRGELEHSFAAITTEVEQLAAEILGLAKP